VTTAGGRSDLLDLQLDGDPSGALEHEHTIQALPFAQRVPEVHQHQVKAARTQFDRSVRRDRQVLNLAHPRHPAAFRRLVNLDTSSHSHLDSEKPILRVTVILDHEIPGADLCAPGRGTGPTVAHDDRRIRGLNGNEPAEPDHEQGSKNDSPQSVLRVDRLGFTIA
jgi:hypothetical protein